MNKWHESLEYSIIFLFIPVKLFLLQRDHYIECSFQKLSSHWRVQLSNLSRYYLACSCGSCLNYEVFKTNNGGVFFFFFISFKLMWLIWKQNSSEQIWKYDLFFFFFFHEKKFCPFFFFVNRNGIISIYILIEENKYIEFLFLGSLLYDQQTLSHK